MTLPERDERQGAGGTSANLHHRHQMMQHFWRRWSKDYLHNLQTRARGARSSAALSIGDLVLVQEDHQPPMQWALGRITELYPGEDGVARVATIRVANSHIRRAVKRLARLPALDQN